MNKKPLVIGVAGGSGSGKSTLVAELLKALGEHAVILCHDYYYKANSHLSFEERCGLNYDHPNALENDLMIEDIIALRNGETIYHPMYDFALHTRKEQRVGMDSAPIILVDGILIFDDPRICELMDIKVYVDTDADVRLMRRITRDVRERGRSLESVLAQYSTTVKPMHEQFVEPSKKQADIIIPEGGHNRVALAMLLGRIREYLAEEDQL